MAGYFKKRRRAPAGPNKNERKVMRRVENEGRDRVAGTLRNHYPSAQKLSIRLLFLSPQHQTLGEETRAFEPDDSCDFALSCPGRCGVGSFNLQAKVDSVVTNRQAVSESSGKCQEPLYGGSPEICGCELRCKMEVVYLPEDAA
jgi:hypothetical protein